MGTPAPVALGKLGIGTADPVTQLLNAEGFNPGYRQELKDTNSTRGVFEKDGNRVVASRIYIQPRFTCNPTVSELAALLEWAFWGTTTGTTTKTYVLGNTPKPYYALWFPNNGDSWFYPGDLAIDSFTLSAAESDGIKFEAECVGKTANNTKNSFPSLTADQTGQTFTLQQLALTLGGATKYVRDFSFRVSYGIDKERHLNSPTLTDLVPLKREISLAVSVPSGDNSGFYDDGATGVAVVATFTNAAGKAFTLTFPDWRFPPVSGDFPQDGEGFLRLEGELYRGASAATPTVLTLVI